MRRLKFINEYIGKVLGAGSRVLVCALVLVVSYSAVTRYVFAQGVDFTEEFAGLLLFGIAVLSFAHVFNVGEHVRVTGFTAKLPTVVRGWVEVIAGLVGLTFSIVLTRLACDFVYLSYLLGCHSPDSHIYEVPWMLLMPIGMLALAIAILVFCIERFHDAVVGKGEADKVEEAKMKIETGM